MADVKMQIKRAITHVIRKEGYPPDVMEVFFLTSREMCALKLKTTGKRVRTVDVLAFETPEGFPHPGRETYFGEVYVNHERFKKNPEYLLFLVIHGFLHLRGFRHARERDTIKMRRMERKIFAEARKLL